MDKKKIEELKEKRILLQEELRLKTLRDRISSQLDYLDEFGFDYRVYYEHEHLDWISKNIPMRKKDGYSGVHDYQIDVNDALSNYDSVYCHSDNLSFAEIGEHFLTVLSKECRLIVCYNGGAPEIEISAEVLFSRPSLFFSRPETWMLTKDKIWIIEYIWEQEVMRFIQLQNMKPVLVKKIFFLPHP